MTKLDTWSPSRFSQWSECPRKAKYKFIEKRPEPSGPAATRGTLIHEKAEQYIKGESSKLPPELKTVAGLAKDLRKHHKKGTVHVELELGFDKNWGLLTNWFQEGVWLRLKIDVVHRITPEDALVIDWKTGRYKPDDPGYGDQLNLYATALVAARMANAARARLVFTDHGEVVDREEGMVTTATVEKYQKDWERRVKPYFNDRKFVAKPGHYCRWCAFSKVKGGPCEF